MSSEDSTSDHPGSGASPVSSVHSYARRALEPGVTLAHRYRVVCLLGQGGTGSVYEAIDEARSGLRVALKLLDEQRPQALYRLKNEFRALAETVHPNLVGLHGLSADPHGWFLIMDLVHPAVDFRSYVHAGAGGALDERRLRSALAQLLRGVCAMHAARKLHRDLKPSNVLVTEEGRLVIVDFGLVGEDSGVEDRAEGWFAGTPAYAAPEQASGANVGPKADLYAVGVLLYEALTRTLPIDEDSTTRLLERKQREDPLDPRELSGDLPADLCAICMSLLQRDPALRPDAAEVLAWLCEERLEARAPRELPFVGRERELMQLGRVAKACRGAPALALVSGATGIGKSALLERFSERERATRDAVVVKGRCHAREQVPYNAFDLLIDELGGHLLGLDPLDAASLMPREAALLARAFPTLARVPAVLRMPSNSSDASDPALLRTRVFAALKELLARVADRRPLILCFDDLQWSDEDSTELLRDLLRGPDAPGCLFVCAFRDGASHEDGSLRAMLRNVDASPLVEIALAPLERAASTELARAVLDGGAGAQTALQALVDEGAGSPFLLKELARGARRHGHVGDLHAAVQSFMAELTTDARALLEVSCIAGRPLMLGAALGTSRAEPRALVEALAAGLLRTVVRSGLEYVEPSHDRIAETVLELIGEPRCAELHVRLAEQLSADAAADPELVARHYRAAGLSARAAPYNVRAAERARQSLAFGRAAELYEIALADAEECARPALVLALAETYANVGRLREAAQMYERALADHEPGPPRRSVAARAMLLYLLAGSGEPGARLADELCRELGIMPRPQMQLLALLAHAWLFFRYLLGQRVRSLPVPTASEHTARSRERLEVCLRASRGFVHVSPDHSVYFGLHLLLATRRHRDRHTWPLAIAGEIAVSCITRGAARERDIRDMQRAVTLAESQGDAETLALVLTTQGGFDLFTCRLDGALTAFERAEHVLAGCGQPVIHDFTGVRNGRLSAWSLAGDFHQVIRHYDAWTAQARALGDVPGELTGRIIGSQRLLALDDPDAAQRSLEDINHSAVRASLLSADPWWIGDIALYQGNPAAAFAAYELARRTRFFARMQRVSSHRTTCGHFLARAALMAAGRHGSGQYLRSAEREARKLSRERFAMGPAAAAQTHAGIARLRGETARALRELTRAADLYARCGTRLHVAAMHYHIGLLRGGEAGMALAAEATSFALASGIRNPERWFRWLAPGFTS